MEKKAQTCQMEVLNEMRQHLDKLNIRLFGEKGEKQSQRLSTNSPCLARRGSHASSELADIPQAHPLFPPQQNCKSSESNCQEYIDVSPNNDEGAINWRCLSTYNTQHSDGLQSLSYETVAVGH